MLRRAVPLSLALAVLGSLGSLAMLAMSAPAQASELRFSITAKGGVVSTGNTLGLSKQPASNGPGTGDSIGTFLSPDNQLFDDFPANLGNPWGAGTSSDWTLNGSSAVLDLPDAIVGTGIGLEILYAELVWGGSYSYGTENVSTDLDVPVVLEANGVTVDVVPDPQTSVTLAEIATQGFAINYYMRSADVTDFVAEQLDTTYTVSGVPATQDYQIEQLNAAGWTLVVVYRYAAAPTRNLTVFVGGQFVEEDDVEDYPVSGFCTPPEGQVEGGVVISALEGDANRTGDTFQIAANANGPFASLSGPNNPSDNFFASQINGVDGNLDALGSAGDANHDAFTGVNVSGGRQGWDVTKLALSSGDGQLSAGQTSAVLRAITTGDSFMPVLAAFEIDVSSPDFDTSSAVEADPASLAIGEQSTITIDIGNDGDVTASDLVLTSPLGSGLELIEFAIDGTAGDIDQQPVATADLASGVEIGDVPAGAAIAVTMVVEAVDVPPMPNGWLLHPSWNYAYVSCVGEDPLSEQSVAFVNLGFDGSSGDGDGDPGDGDGDGDPGDGDGDGDGGTDGEGDGGSSTDGGSDLGETGDDFGSTPRDGDGCNCRSTAPITPAGTLALLGLLGLFHRRR